MTSAGASGVFCAAVVLVALAAPISAGHAETGDATIAVRSGNHADFGRVVIGTTGKTIYTLDQDGDHLILRLSGEGTLGPAPAMPRNVVSIRTDGSALDLTLRHGAKVHPWRLD